MREYFWVCIECDAWSCHLGSVPLLHVGGDAKEALMWLVHEHMSECPGWARFKPVDELSRNFRVAS